MKLESIEKSTSSAVFHLASCPSRFWPAQTLVWMIFRNSCPVRGLKMKIAPLMGFVVRLPSNVLWMVTCAKQKCVGQSSTADSKDIEDHKAQPATSPAALHLAEFAQSVAGRVATKWVNWVNQ